jgi:hypothetical protein
MSISGHLNESLSDNIQSFALRDKMTVTRYSEEDVEEELQDVKNDVSFLPPNSNGRYFGHGNL